MDRKSPKDAQKPALDGSLTIEELTERHNLVEVTLGKRSIQDIGRRLAQIRGLKPGSSSIRTIELIDELLTRLNDGESLTSILCDSHMPAPQTLWNWRDKDDALDESIKSAQARGQHVLADLRTNIAAGGEFSTGDINRDRELIKAINANIAQRNRPEFGEQRAFSVTHSHTPVMLAPIPNLPDISHMFLDDPANHPKDDEQDDKED